MGMMQPVALWSLAALAPIVIAYLLRMPRRRMPIPHAAPWLALTESDRRISNERRTMIALALQLIVAAALAVALVKPYVASSGESRHRIVVLDCSRSMRACDATVFKDLEGDQRAVRAGPSRMRLAVARVSALIASMAPDDRMTLIAAGTRPRLIASGEREPATLGRALAGIDAVNEVADLRAACALAVELAKSAERPEVDIVTDGSIDERELDPLAELAKEAGSAHYLRTGRASDNLGVVRLKARRDLSSEADVETIVTVASSCREAREIGVALDLDVRTLGIQRITVPPGGEATAVFRTPYRAGGVLRARLRVQDALADDDESVDWLPAPRRMDVAFVRKEALDAKALQDYYLTTILKCDAGIAPGFLPADEYLAVARDRKALKQMMEAAVFENWAPEREEDLPPGHCLFINCESPAIPVVVKGLLGDKPLIRRWNSGHPLMTHLNLRDVFLTKAKELSPAAPDEDAVVDLVSSSLVIAREVGGRKLVYIGFDPQDSDIRFKKELPLLVFNCFQWFKRGVEPVTQVAPGDPIRLAVSDRSWTSITVLPPSGAQPETLPVLASAADIAVVHTAAPGIYRWFGEGERSPQRGFAVVFQDARETRLQVAEHPEVGARDAKGALVANRIEAEDATAGAKMSGLARQWWPILMWTALVALVVEAWLFHRRIFF